MESHKEYMIEFIKDFVYGEEQFDWLFVDQLCSLFTSLSIIHDIIVDTSECDGFIEHMYDSISGRIGDGMSYDEFYNYMIKYIVWK